MISMPSNSVTDTHPAFFKLRTALLRCIQPRFLLELGLFIAVYHIVSTFNVAVSSLIGNVAYIWLAAGISYAVIFLWGYRFALGVLLGEISEIFLLDPIDTHQIVVGAGNALALVIGVWLTKRFMHGNHCIFYRASHVVSFILFGALLVGVISASIATPSLYLNRSADVDVGNIEQWFNYWWPWCLSNVISILILSPILISFRQRNVPGLYRPWRFELLTMLVSGGFVVSFVFGSFIGYDMRGYPLTFCFMPFILWAAFRFGQRETNLVLFAMSTLAIIGTELNLGPFADIYIDFIPDNMKRAHPALLLQAFIAVLCITTFFLLSVINERKRFEDSLRASHEQLEETVKQRTAELHETSKQYQDIFENALEGIYQFDLDGRLLKVNPSMSNILGFDDPESAIAGIKNINDLYLEPEQRNEFFRLLSSNGYVAGHESEIVSHQEERLWVVENGRTVRDEHNGDILYYEGSMFNITRRKQAEAQLFDMAHHDLLTGLANRRLFYQVLIQAVKRAGRTGKTGVLMYFDLDEFKRVNDTLGHEFGDELLKETASRLKACVRETDLIGRIGGDEFTLVAENIEHEADAEKLAENIIETLSVPFVWEEHEARIGVSIGITFFDGLHSDIDRLLKESDDAMYRAKRSGKSTHRFYRAF